jgi:outer membrane receptor protein involved in Fe transport
VWNYEGGIKSYFPDRRLLLNASVYYYKCSNLQTLNLVSNGNGNLPAYQVTISDQHAEGLDLETHWYSNNLFDKRYVTGISNISATTLEPLSRASAHRDSGA